LAKPSNAGSRRSPESFNRSSQINTVQQVTDSDTECTGWFVFVSEHTLMAVKDGKSTSSSGLKGDASEQSGRFHRTLQS
jgi:hypothetical protein